MLDFWAGKNKIKPLDAGGENIYKVMAQKDKDPFEEVGEFDNFGKAFRAFWEEIKKGEIRPWIVYEQTNISLVMILQIATAFGLLSSGKVMRSFTDQYEENLIQKILDISIFHAKQMNVPWQQ